MKRTILAIAVLALLGLVGSAAMAADDTSDVIVSVGTIDLLTLTDGGTITLTGTAGSDALAGDDDATAVLNYTHNSATSKKISAEVIEANVPAGTQDITLTVSVADGAGEVTLATDGIQGAGGVVYTGIAAGILTNKTVTYGASATASGTRADDYTWTVTFTSADVE